MSDNDQDRGEGKSPETQKSLLQMNLKVIMFSKQSLIF